MGFMAVALVVALVVVVVTRGSLRRLARLPVEGFTMLFAALVIQAAIGYVGLPRTRIEDLGFGVLILSYACILGFCLGNLRIRGMAIVTIGIALNAVVIALNQGMPAKGPTRVDARGHKVSAVVTSVKHRPERANDLLKVLDDRIMLPRPFHELLSFGDLILAMGLIDVCYWGSRREEHAWMSVFVRAPHAEAGAVIETAPAQPRTAAPIRPQAAASASVPHAHPASRPDRPAASERDDAALWLTAQ